MAHNLQVNDEKDYLKWTSLQYKHQAALLSLLSLKI
jgi:hypothetical protein